MKIRLIFIFFLVAAAGHFSFGQSNVTAMATEGTMVESAPMYTALYVLKSDLRSIELDPKKNEIFDVKSVDQKHVKFVTVLSGKEGRKIYGEKGSTGVVIVQLADFYDLSREGFIKLKKDN
ncbi:MAG: hypothetical protein WEB30_09325 [Cyclobacteriaceae bacterium]